MQLPLSTLVFGHRCRNKAQTEELKLPGIAIPASCFQQISHLANTHFLLHCHFPKIFIPRAMPIQEKSAGFSVEKLLRTILARPRQRDIYGEPASPCLFSLFGFSFWAEEFKANSMFSAKPEP